MTPTDPAPSAFRATQQAYLALTRRRRLYSWLGMVIFVATYAAAFQTVQEANAGDFLSGISQIFDFPNSVISEAVAHADRLPGYMLDVLPALLETLNIAAVATLLGTVGGIVLSLMISRGLAPSPRLIAPIRRIADVLRAFPEIVVALVLIFVLGAGPVPAMIAIAVHTAGTLGKLFSEVNENVDLKPVEGLSSVGASWMQRMVLGVFPQVMPNYSSYALMRFEINVRASAILGFVGAGGIGYDLKNAMTFGQGKYDEAAAIFIVLFSTIVVFDQISSLVRNRLTQGGR